MSDSSREMPRYQSHKQVHALKIQHIHHFPNPDITGASGAASYGGVIHPEDKNYSPFDISADYICKHRPMPGGYYVVYDDGYESYSPAEPFEAGYSLIK